jgi:hypothetical protein
MQSLDIVAPAFVAMAHRIVWAIAGTTDRSQRPATRVLHPIWERDGDALVGWIATSPTSPKAAHLAAQPHLSLTYWDASHDTCTADCRTEWDTTDEGRRALWERFKAAPAPLGYDPSIVPGWDSPASPGFGALRLFPYHLRVMPGSLLMAGQGELLTWRQAA